MQWLDDDVTRTSLVYAPVTETHAQMWPIVAALGLSGI